MSVTKEIQDDLFYSDLSDSETSSQQSDTSDSRTRLTVLISGSGTNLQAVIDALANPDSPLPPSKIVRVISNRAKAYGLTRAKAAGIPTKYHNLKRYKDKQPSTEQGVSNARKQYDAKLAKLVLRDTPELVLCLGFMHIVSEDFLTPLRNGGVEIINLHPALPGQFNGIQAIERAHAAWQEGKITKTGVMIHNVISAVDEGEPIYVKEIPFVKGEDEDIDKFEEKVHSTEWEAVIEGAKRIITQIRARKGL